MPTKLQMKNSFSSFLISWTVTLIVLIAWYETGADFSLKWFALGISFVIFGATAFVSQYKLFKMINLLPIEK